MITSSNTARAVAAIAFMVSLIQFSGCAAQGAAQLPFQAAVDTVDICYTRAMHTECFQQSADDYAEEMESYRESMELSEEW